MLKYSDVWITFWKQKYKETENEGDDEWWGTKEDEVLLGQKKM